MTDLETAARALLAHLDSRPTYTVGGAGGMTIDSNVKATRLRDVSLWEVEEFREALEAALAAPEFDPPAQTVGDIKPGSNSAAIRRAALEEATEAIRRTPSLDLDGFVIGTMEAIAAIRALADREPTP